MKWSGKSSSQKGVMTARQAQQKANAAQRAKDFKAAKKVDKAAAERIRNSGQKR